MNKKKQQQDFKKRQAAAQPTDNQATATVGASGSVLTDGYLVHDENNSRLVNGRQYKTYSDLLANISIVSAGVRYFLNLVSKAQWKVMPSDPENEEAVRFSKLIAKQMTRMDISWARIIRRAAMYRFYGFSIQEWTTDMDEGFHQYCDVSPRPQSTIEKWDTDVTGKVTGIHQRVPQTEELIQIPRFKLVYLVDDSLNDSPEGLGLFRHIVSSCDRLKRYEQLEGYGFESDLRGIPIGRAPFATMQEAVNTGLMTAQQKLDAEAPITNFIKNHIKNPALGILVDSLTYQSVDEKGMPTSVKQWDVDLLKGGSSALPDMARAIERVNREIARILGVEGLLLGEQTTGSHALSSDKALNFALIVDSTLSELTDAFQRDFIQRLFVLNGWDMELMPVFETDAMQHRDITQVTQALSDLANAGAPMDPNDPATNEIRALLGVSPQPVATPEIINARNGATNTDAASNTNDEE